MTAHRSFARYSVVLAMVLTGSAASAQETVVALSPEARATILAAAADRPARPEVDLPINGSGRNIHGEVGVMIGTGGARGVFGSALAPLGEDGSAMIAFENTRLGRPR